jgi:hypothetical protein
MVIKKNMKTNNKKKLFCGVKKRLASAHVSMHEPE